MERLPIPSCKLNADNCHHKPNKRQLFFVQPASILNVDCICTVCCAAHRGENLRLFSPDPSFRAFPLLLKAIGICPQNYSACVHGATSRLAAGLSVHSRLIARPPLILATIVARLLLLTGKSIFACGLRARRQPPRTRALNVPQWTSKTWRAFALRSACRIL